MYSIDIDKDKNSSINGYINHRLLDTVTELFNGLKTHCLTEADLGVIYVRSTERVPIYHFFGCWFPVPILVEEPVKCRLDGYNGCR